MRTTFAIDDALYQKALEGADSNIDKSDIFREVMKTFVQVQASEKMIGILGKFSRAHFSAACPMSLRARRLASLRGGSVKTLPEESAQRDRLVVTGPALHRGAMEACSARIDPPTVFALASVAISLINALVGGICAVSAYLFSLPAFAEPVNALTVETGIGAIARTVVGLLTVLGLILACAWIARRLGIRPSLRRTGVIQLVDSLALTQREKVVVIEVNGTWLVLGVAQGNIRLLHQCAVALARSNAQ